jgi:hypothetical protein
MAPAFHPSASLTKNAVPMKSAVKSRVFRGLAASLLMIALKMRHVRMTYVNHCPDVWAIERALEMKSASADTAECAQPVPRTNRFALKMKPALVVVVYPRGAAASMIVQTTNDAKVVRASPQPYQTLPG